MPSFIEMEAARKKEKAARAEKDKARRAESRRAYESSGAAKQMQNMRSQPTPAAPAQSTAPKKKPSAVRNRGDYIDQKIREFTGEH